MTNTIKYINYSMNDIEPSLPRYILNITGDSIETIITLNTNNNKYMTHFPPSYFNTIFNSIKDVITLPLNKHIQTYYGDELLINVNKVYWINGGRYNCIFGMNSYNNKDIQNTYDNVCLYLFSLIKKLFGDKIIDTYKTIQ